MRKLTYLSTLVLIFTLPWEDSISIPGLGSPARLMGFVIAGFWLGTILVEGTFRKPSFFHVLVLLFFLWNCVSVFWSSDIENTLQRVKTYGQIFLLIFIYWDVFRNREDLVGALQAFVLGAYVLIGSTIYNYLTGNIAVQYEGRYSATGVNANDVALILILGLPIALSIGMQMLFVPRRNIKGSLLQVMDLLYIPLSIFSIVLTGSRTSLIAVIPFVIFTVGTQWIKFEQKILMFVILQVPLLALLPFVPQSVITRISTIGNSISEADLGGRVTLWRKSIVVLAQHPILGVGSGAIDRAIGGAVHNTLISVVTETGFTGLVLFLCVLGLVVYLVARLPRRTSGLWLAIFTIWAIGAFSLSWEFRKITWIILSFIIIESGIREQLGEQEKNINLIRNILQETPTSIGLDRQDKKRFIYWETYKNVKSFFLNHWKYLLLLLFVLIDLGGLIYLFTGQSLKKNAEIPAVSVKLKPTSTPTVVFSGRAWTVSIGFLTATPKSLKPTPTLSPTLTATASPTLSPTFTATASPTSKIYLPLPTNTLVPANPDSKPKHTPIPPTSVPPTSIPPTSVPPTSIPPTSIPPTSVPPTPAPPLPAR